MDVSKIKYIDVHAHPHFSAFDKDRGAVFERMQQSGVACIAVATNFKTSKIVLEYVDKFDLVLAATVGVHPTEKETFNKEKYKHLINANIRAVGECGLDYYRMDATDINERRRQKDLFEAQIEFAIENNLPLMLHIRSSSGSADAHNDSFEILKYYKNQFTDLKLHMHFFTANLDVARKFLELDSSFGIPGVVTFSAELQDTVKYIPKDKLLVESDAPYAAPVPYRGKRNESGYVIYTADTIAKIKNIDIKILKDNALRVFNLA